MNDDVVSLKEVFVKPHGLHVYRIEQHDSAIIFWTTRDAVLQYLKSLQAKRLTIVERR